MNPADLFRFRGNWQKFVSNHPKFPMFLGALKNTNITEGTIVELKVTTTDGRDLCTNVKLTRSDLDMINDIKKMASK